MWGAELKPRPTDSGKRSKAIFIEPKILPWLASKAGVRLPVARAIWRKIASKRYADGDVLSCDEVARRQIDDLRRQLKEAGEPTQSRPVGSELLRWMFPFSLGLRTLDMSNPWLKKNPFMSMWLSGAKRTTTRGLDT